MIKRYNYSVAKFPNDRWDNDSIISILNKSRYTDEQGLGVLDFSTDGAIIEGFILKRIPTYIDDYNHDTNEIIKKSIFIFSEIQFYFDINYGLLYSVGPQSNLTQVRLLFKRIGNQSFEMQNSEISPFDVFKLFLRKKVRFEIDEVCIDKFIYLNGAIGKFSAKTIKSEVVKNLVYEYKNDCCKIVFNVLRKNSAPFRFSIFNNGSMTLFADNEEQENNFEYLKKIIF